MSTAPETAVQRCLDAYNQACARDDARNDHSPESLDRVGRAYRHAMPFLTSDPDSIDAFIACVTHGLVIQVFQPAEASKLLYAAQVAITSRRARAQIGHPEQKAKDLHFTTPSPLPQGTDGAGGAVGRTAGASRKSMQAVRNQVDELLEQLHAGKLPAELAPQPFAPAMKKAPAQAPPPPSPCTGTHALTC
jgi:hypothetical protein